MRILYLEDSVFDADLARRALARDAPEFSLIVAETLSSARQILKSAKRIDAMLLDLDLPDGGGLELLSELRERSLPIAAVVLTGSGDEETIRAALKAGADDFLLKAPGYLSELASVIHSAQRKAARRLVDSERRFRTLFEQTQEIAVQGYNRERKVIFWNQASEKLYGYRADEAMGSRLEDLIIPEPMRADVVAAVDQWVNGGVAIDAAELPLRRKDGSITYVFSSHVMLESADGDPEMYCIDIDVSDRVNVRALQHARNEVLNRIVADESLEVILDLIIQQVEHMLPGLRCTIMLIDDDDCFGTIVSRSLPDFYIQALQDLRVGDGVGSCGAAAWSGERMIAEDVRTHPNWSAYLEIAQRADIGACWSLPFKDEAGQVLGTFALYSRVPHCPDQPEQALIDDFARLASVAVQKRRAIEMLAQREHALTMSAHAGLALLREPDLGLAIERVLETGANMADVDRAYVFTNRLAGDDGEIRTTLTHEWVRDGIPSQRDNPDLQDVPMSIVGPRWLETLSSGRLIVGDVKNFPASERALLEPQGIRSVIIVPIEVGSTFWGFIGFDSVHRRKRWTKAEENVLWIIANSLSAAIERKQALEHLRRSAAAFESTRDGVLITDLTPSIVAVNRAFSEITGYSEAEALGRNPNMLRSGHQDLSFYREMWANLGTAGHWQGEIWNRRKSGEVYPQWLTISTVMDEQGLPCNYVGVMTDISQLKRSEARLERMAHYDPLTDLPNRVLARLRLEHAIEQADRYARSIAVLFIDLDRFKNVNDSFGHPVGDELLVEIARRLKNRVRSEDTFARLGGDEFLLILERVDDPPEVGQIAQALIDLLDTPFVLSGGQEVYIGSSVGISLYPGDGRTTTELIQHADAAMYQAKADGRNTYRFFTAELSIAAQKRLNMETRLRRALDRGEFVVYYQPKVNVSSGCIVGCEALLRWLDPERGLISPAEFIPVAEEIGLIVPLGEWVLRTACEQAEAWHQAGLPRLNMAVNLSVRQLWKPDLAERIAGILIETGLPAQWLELELTESMIMGQEVLVEERFAALKALGLRLAIDDFGTGYSSLAYLKRFPIDVLKIDGSFVRDIPEDVNDMEIATAIVAMARALKLEVVAEGVETLAQLAFLQEQTCDIYQGYLFSKPLSTDDFEKLLVDSNSARA